jgi:diadenosine tetraphosphate (Ap4A) HIT family hydrolase
MTRTWPDDWEARKRGEGCPFCAGGSSNPFHRGRTSDAQLERKRVAKGHAVVVFRGRHAASLNDLSEREVVDFWKDVQDVGRVLERAFGPCHMNYLLMGNVVPHLHVHVVPRYVDDAAPERPLPWEPREVPAAEYEQQLQALQNAARP